MEKQLSTEGVLILKLESKESLETILKYTKLVDEIFKSNPQNPTKEETKFGIGYNKDNFNKEIYQQRFGNTESLKKKTKEFQEIFEKVFKLFDEEARKSLKKIFSKNENLLKKIENSLDPIIEDISKDGNYVSSSVLTVCKYFEDGKKLQCPSHTDQGLFTFIIELDIVALQIYKPRKESNYSFINKEGSKNNQQNIIVLPGEQMSIISNRQINPTIHRVLKTGKERISIFFKLRLRPQYLGPMTDADYSLVKTQMNVKLENTFTSLASQLPEELIFIISFYASIEDVMKMRLVCSNWKESIDSDKLWKFLSMAHYHVIGKDIKNWKEIYIKKYQRNKDISIHKSAYDLYIESLGKLQKIEKFGFKNSNEKPKELPKELPKNLKLNTDSCKLVIVGSENVGKTCLLLRFATGNYPQEYSKNSKQFLIINHFF